MSSRVPQLKTREPLDLRIAVVFVVLTLALVAPGVMGAIRALDDQALHDAASTLESQSREAVALVGRRARMTEITFSAELQDLAGVAQQAREDLRHHAVETKVAGKRDQLADLAGQVADAAGDASLAAADNGRLERDRAVLEKLVTELHALGGGS